MTTLEPLPASSDPNAAASKPILLIVDDEPGPREALRFVFKDRFECFLAASGQEGIAVAREHPVDVAILDIRMPDIGGIEVLRELKQIDPDIECIMLTGYETIESARAAVHYGAAEYLYKPFDVFVIRETVQNCLQRRQRKRVLQAEFRALQQQNAELARTIAAAARAQVANMLSAGVVHELNNPLHIIGGYVQLLDRDLAKLTAGDRDAARQMQQRVAAIQREIQRCREIAERFLRFSRCQENPLELVNVASLIEDVAYLLRAHPAARSVRIEAHQVGNVAHILAASVELMQILLNLGINALQAINGTGSVRYVAEQLQQGKPDCLYRTPTYAPERPHVRISVTDTGCGIPPEDLPKLFEPYFTTKPHGTGLGLAVVAELLKKYHGAAHVVSEVGKGSTFEVYLPQAT
ncbi:MAG: response regulator [Verrucomicrobiae bacterium]|nr:response regulator [Verrucomicrobiae bacterium]